MYVPALTRLQVTLFNTNRWSLWCQVISAQGVDFCSGHGRRIPDLFSKPGTFFQW